MLRQTLRAGGDAKVADHDAVVRHRENLGEIFGRLWRVAIDKEVVRLQVSMYISFGLHICQGFYHLQQYFHHHVFGQRSQAQHQVAGRQPSGHIFHNDEDAVLVAQDIVTGYDVGVA